ncbi:uncharacterized protein LOC142181967 [Nicotiana tabacum]|uniref:Uncharacterized protein LOC142181967 n=1 Tax=Nicotiana tabacum TaxID=4097 RepID=A0AC58UQM4_TOBAC
MFFLSAIKEHFEFYVDRSSNTRYTLVCTDEKCGGTVRGSRIKESTLFKIVKFQRTHECSVDIKKSHQRQATSNVIRDYMIDNLRYIATEVKPKFVISEMKRAHGIDIGYGKAWHAIQKERCRKQVCLHVFMYGASISGWKYCRPLIAIDGTFLKNKYRGVLLVAVIKDANTSFGVAESEKTNHMNDRHKAIANRIAKVFPECYHGICIYHLEKNLEQRRVRNTVINLFQSTTRIYIQSEFDDFMSQIAVFDKKTLYYLIEEPPGR